MLEGQLLAGPLGPAAQYGWAKGCPPLWSLLPVVDGEVGLGGSSVLCTPLSCRRWWPWCRWLNSFIQAAATLLSQAGFSSWLFFCALPSFKLRMAATWVSQANFLNTTLAPAVYVKWLVAGHWWWLFMPLSCLAVLLVREFSLRSRQGHHVEVV